MMAALAATAAMTACQQENLEPDAQEQETVEVKVTIGEQTKGFTDLEGITWEVGDQIKYAGGVELTSEALTAEKISADGYTASFTFAASLNEVDRTGWFCSTKCHPTNNNEVEFTLGAEGGNIFTQDVAGQMNSRYLFLHSGTDLVSITAGETPEIQMDVVGTIFRLIPYTTKYNDEAVVSVKMSSNTGLVGTVAYDRGGNSYRDVNDVNWRKYNFVTVNLGTPFSLDGITSADKGMGVYVPVAATKDDAPLNGYQYVVETDVATYTFDAMDKTLVVDENVVKNVLLNLDKAQRIAESDFLGYIYYDGNPQSNVTLPPTAGVTGSLGYTVARVCDLDGIFNGQATETVGVHEWLYNAKITYTDSEGNVIPENESWVRAGFMPNQICHWMLEYDANVGIQRSMKIVAKLLPPENYLTITAGGNLTPKTFVYTFNVTQNEAITAEVTDKYVEMLPNTAGTYKVGILEINGSSNDIQSAISKYGLTFDVNGGASVVINDDASVSLTVPANDIAITSKYTLTVNYGTQVLDEVVFTQAAGESSIIFPTLEYIFGAWQPEVNTQNLSKEPTGITAWGVVINQVKSDGNNLPDITSDNVVTKMAVIQKTLGIAVGEDLCYDWVKFEVEGGFGEVRVLVGAQNNDTGERRTKTFDVYNSDGTSKGTLVVNQDA